MATCPDCDAEIDVEDDDLDEMELGDPWDCDACGTRLRVISLEPLDFESDDDDDDDDDDDEEKEKEADVEEDVDEDVEDTDDDKEDWDE